MPDYIPQADTAFDAWQTNFVAYVTANLAGLGLAPADIAALTGLQTTWNAKLPAHVTAAAAAEAARQGKDNARGTFETEIRRLVRVLQASAAVDDAERQAMGITVPDATPTPVGPPVTRPVVKVDTSQRLRHTIHFADESTPTSKAKPAGVRGAQVWMKVGDPAPADASECVYVATDTRTPHTIDFDGADGKKNGSSPNSGETRRSKNVN